MRLAIEHVGYFTSIDHPPGDLPKYDLPSEVPCPLCEKSCRRGEDDVEEDHIIWHPLGRNAGNLMSLDLFYRVHCSCAAREPARLALAEMFVLRHGYTIARGRLS